jgi:hypothetical protein
MEHYIEKNILIDELLELEISYVHELLNIFEELRNRNDITPFSLKNGTLNI